MVASYATNQQFRAFTRDPSASLDDTVITMALSAASRKVDAICGRHFYPTTETQYFSPRPNSPWILDLDDMDLASTDALTVGVQWANGSNYAETRTFGTDFIVQPINQSVNGIDGWPYTSLQSLAKLWPPRYVDFYEDTVKITGTWGWVAVPDPVVQATLMLARDYYKGGESPFDVAGFGEFGVLRARESPIVLSALQPFKKFTSLLMA